MAYPAVAPVWAPLACRGCSWAPQASGPGHAWSHRGYPRRFVRPAAGHTGPLRVRLRLSPVVLPLMPPAPRLLLQAARLQPGGGALCSPGAVRTRDSAGAGPHPTPRPVHPTAWVSPPTPGPPALGTEPAHRRGCGHPGPNRAPAPRAGAGHAATSAPGTAPGVSASSVRSPGPRGLWPAPHR